MKKYLFILVALLSAMTGLAQEQPKYTLTVSVNNEQGAMPNGSGQYEAGQNVYVYVNLFSDYKLEKWTLNGEDIEADVSKTGFNFTMPDHDVELMAYVAYDPQTPDDPNVEVHIYHTLTVVTLPANTGINVDTYTLEEGKTQRLSYPNLTDYHILGWWLNGEQLSNEGNFDFVMPDHDVTLERRYAYNPELPGEPATNNWYYLSNGLIELVIDNFKEGNLTTAIDVLHRTTDFKYDDVGSVIVKGKCYYSDFRKFYNMPNVYKVDFTRTNLDEIDSYAWDESAIETVLLPSSLKKIQYNAFRNCTNLKSITCLATTPPETDKQAFNGVPEGVIVYVPASSVQLYQEAEVWKDFIIQPVVDELTSISVTLPLACADGRCKDMRLEVQNAMSGVRQKYIISDRMTYTFDLVNNSIYNVYLVTQQGEVLSQMENVEVGETPVSLTLPDLKPLFDVTAHVVQNNGNEVTDRVNIKWYDADGNYLTTGTKVSRLTEGYQVYADVTLSDELARVCELPERVDYTVTDGKNDVLVTLQPMAQKTLSTLVVNDENGTYLNGAWVQATQVLHGSYNHNASGATDTYGNCELTLFSGTPVALTVSLDGYYTQTINLDNLAGIDHLPTVRLKPFKGTTIALLVQGYDDYKDLYVTVYDNTKDVAVGDARLQYPYLVLPESVEEDDVLGITIHSQEQHFGDMTQTMVVKDGKLTFNILANGNLEASYGTSKNEAVNAMLYDSDGKLVESKKCEARKATFSYQSDGEYTVVMMGSSSLFSGINSLADFDRLGLHANSDYVKQAATVHQGETATAEFASVPLFVESCYNYFGSNASFICTTPNPRGGNAATFRAALNFKDAYAAGVSKMNLFIEYDDNAEFIDNSVVLNTKLHDYAKGSQMVEIDGLKHGDEVKLCLMPKNDGIFAVSAFVEFDYGGWRVRQLLGSARLEASSVEMIIPEQTPQPEVTINMRNIPYGQYKSVEFYDNGVLIASISDLESVASYMAANWGSTATYLPGNKATIRCKLNDPYYYSYHNIQAKFLKVDGTCLLTRTKTVQYNPAAIVLSDLGFYEKRVYTRWSHDSGYSDPNSTVIEDHNVIDIGCISNSLSARSYTLKPEQHHKQFYYYVHFLQNDYLPNMLKDKSVVLTKYYDHDKQTVDFHMNNWMQIENPLTFNLRDDNIFDDRYLKYGEPIPQDYYMFMYPENCDIDELPTNFGLDYEYADDFVFPEDKESNNRFVKMMKAALAEQERLISQLNSVIEQIQAKIDNKQTDWNTLKPLVEEANSLANKLNGGAEVTLTPEQEQLVQKLTNEATTDAEREAIWNQLCPDLTQTEEYKKVEQWNLAQMTSQIYIPPYELAEGVWTPSYTYIVGTPTTGNILQDMSDGNWYLDENESDYDACKFVFVNDKGGDRFIIDASEHLAEASASRASAKKSDGYTLRNYISSVFGSIDSAFGDYAIGKVSEAIANAIAEKMAVNANLALAQAAAALDQSAINSALNPNNPALKDIYQKALDKYTKVLANSDMVAKVGTGVKAVASSVGVGLTIYSAYKTSQENFENYYKDDWAWEQMIMFADANCGSNGDAKRLMQQMEEARGKNGLKNGIKIAANAVTALASTIIGLAAPEAGTAATMVAVGLDCTIEGAYMAGKNKLIDQRKDLARQLSQIPGCEHARNFFPISDGFTPLIDPSGYVYEAVPSNRLEGVTATCYYKDSIQNEYGDWEVKEQLWNAGEFEQVNPQLTDNAGKYGWDVPMGMWQVRYAKDGYEATKSEWLPVPPPQLEVNIPMVQRTAPEVKTAHAYQDGVELLFTKYMQPELLTPEQLKVKVVRGGKETLLSDVKVELLNEEAAAKGDTTTYASHLRLTSVTGWKDADEVLLIVNHRVKSYCGVPMQEDYMQHLDIEMRIEQIEAEKMEIPLGESQELKVAVKPAQAGAGKTLRLSPTADKLVELSADEVVLDAQGKATVTVTGKSVGSASIMLTIDGELAEQPVMVQVLDAANMIVDKPEATPGSGTILKVGDKVTLTSDTKDAQIWYTTDGSCPCDEQGSRKLYTEPIVINGETVIKAMAVKNGWYDSDIATFIFVVESELVGISDAEQPKNTNVQIYDLQGRKIDASQAHKGVFIVIGGGDMKPRKTVIK